MIYWEMARYIIDAKKNIDTMMYIEKEWNDLSNLDMYEHIDGIIRQFYLSCCYVLDYYIKNSKKSKKSVCADNEIIDSIYYERDKNIGHKDKNYKIKTYKNISEYIGHLKKQLNEVRKICESILPNDLTLDYVPHDKLLFRFTHRLNPKLEIDLSKIKYPSSVFHSYQLSDEGKHYFKDYDTMEQDKMQLKELGVDDATIMRILHSTDEIRILSEEEKKHYMIMINDGLNSYEGIQNRQDACIKSNLLYGTNIWLKVNWDEVNRIEHLIKIGFLDDFEMLDCKNMKEL